MSRQVASNVIGLIRADKNVSEDFQAALNGFRISRKDLRTLEFDWDFGGPYRQIIVEYDATDGEIISIEDWHGNEVSDLIYQSAEERMAEILDSEKETKK